jgi:hypothetical protein
MREREYIDREVLDDLYEEFVKLATEKLKPEERQSLNIDIHILDRTRYEMDHYEPVPYEERSYTEEEYEQVLRALISNMNTASEALNRWCRGRMTIKGPVSSATDSQLAEDNRRLVETSAEMSDDLRRLRNDQGAIIRTDEAVKRARGQRNDLEDFVRHLWRCKAGPSCEECIDYQKKHRLDDR